MKLKLKNIFLFAFFWFLFFVISESVLKLIFEDTTPTWKILTISMISVFGVLFPYLNKEKEFNFGDITKFQKREIMFNRAIEKEFLESLAELLKINDFKVINRNNSEINFKSKVSRQNFGEKFSISIKKNRLIIKSKPKFILGFLDEGNARKNVIKIEELIKKLL